MTSNSVIIAGAGQAGFQMAASLRQGGFPGRIVLVGDEPGLPYQRPPLSKSYLVGKADAAGLRLRPAKFYADQRIEVLHGRITAIDRTNRCVELQDGHALDYDHLVLALGAHNRLLPVPGAELADVRGLRTLQDADALAQRLGYIRNVVVVGAGFIGLEFASAARAAGAAVHVLELGDRLMSRAVTPQVSRFFQAAHEANGIVFSFREGLARIDGEEGKVVRVHTTSGKLIAADLVVFGIGVLPNVQLAAEAGLHTEDGIRVDPYLLTSDPSISAIGDAVSFPSRQADRYIRLESVQNAVDQARCVAARLNGQRAIYAAIPWFWSDQGNLKLQMAGLAAGHDSTVLIGDESAAQFSVLCFKGRQLIAVESVNRSGDHMSARKILAGPASPTPAEASAPGFDLKVWEAVSR